MSSVDHHSSAVETADATPQSGFILILVIWALALLAVLVLSFSVSVRTHTQSVGNLIANGEAEAIADAGVHLAIAKLLKASDGGSAGQARLPRDERDWVCRVEGYGDLWISVEDEGGKIDINTASDELLVALFRTHGLSQPQAWALVDAVVDFRDADDLRRANGAEAMEYTVAGKAYGATNRPYASVEELDQVLGMKRGLFETVRDQVTVYSRQQGIDPEVSENNLVRTLARASSVSVENADLVALRPEFVTPSNAQAFMIKVTARHDRGGVFARRAIIELSADPSTAYAMRDWHRDDDARRAEPLSSPPPPC